MSTLNNKYCLDTNVLIQAWQRYYSPKFCSGYWDMLIDLGKKEIIFLPDAVYEEIAKTEDELLRWLKTSDIPVHKITEPVTICLSNIYKHNPSHKYLVDNTRSRSQADPWVIAHAMNENAVVVTKEEKITAPSSTKIKIPNVCDNMGIRCINDFEFIHELNIKFTCLRQI